MLNQVSNSLLLPSGLQLSDLTKVLDHFSSRQIDYADLYFQFSQDESWSLEDS
ncbi:metalloprotease TldD, partial [Glaesserella parasuis]|nr:metalloprotease TldD [Glaesserella parasuis]